MPSRCAIYIAACKDRLGNPRMSDRELGVHLGGYTQQNIARAKLGYMTDPIALRIADLLGIDAGEVLVIARAERENDEQVKQALVAYVGKIAGLLPMLDQARPVSAAGPDAPALAGIDVAMPARKQNAPMVSHGGVSIGGEGGIRTHGTLCTYA